MDFATIHNRSFQDPIFQASELFKMRKDNPVPSFSDVEKPEAGKQKHVCLQADTCIRMKYDLQGLFWHWGQERQFSLKRAAVQ